MKIWRTEDLAWRRIVDETIVVHLTRHRIYSLNEAGGRLWEDLAAPLEGDRLARLLEDPAVNAFLADLVDEGMVESDGPLPASPAPPPSEDDPAAPRIEWREEVRRFAGGCGLLPGAGGLCHTPPTNS